MVITKELVERASEIGKQVESLEAKAEEMVNSPFIWQDAEKINYLLDRVRWEGLKLSESCLQRRICELRPPYSSDRKKFPELDSLVETLSLMGDQIIPLVEEAKSLINPFFESDVKSKKELVETVHFGGHQMSYLAFELRCSIYEEDDEL